MSMVNSFSLRIAMVLLGSCLLLVGNLPAQEAQEPVAETPASEEPAADPFAVPEDATAEELLEFIQSVRQPKEPPKTREEAIAYMQQAAAATSQAADQLLAGEAAAAQKIQATQAKIQALAMGAQLGNADAEAQLETFLDQVLESDSKELVQFAKQVRLLRQIGKWNQLEPQDRQAIFDEMVADVKQTEEPTVGQAKLVSMLADRLADTPEREQAAAAVEELIPVFRKSSHPEVVQRLASMEGVVRRLRLPGSVMEVTGTLLDGEPVDWESYRGKVVLVDYWATWCGPCEAEVPNLLENYQAYHDKGFEVLGISLDEDKAAVEYYLSKWGITWPTLFGTEEGAIGWEHPMVKYYGINGIPAAILVDADGKVVEMNASGPRLGAKLQELLGDPLPPTQATDDATADPTMQTSTVVPE